MDEAQEGWSPPKPAEVAAFTVLAFGSIIAAVIGLQLASRWSLKHFAVGFVGWILAMLVRVPVALVARRLENRNLLVLASGPAEELVRLVAVGVLASTSWEAGLIGFGWATVEVMQAAGTGFALVKLAQRRDEKSEQAVAQLQSMGMDRVTSVFDGLLERIAVSSFHVAASLVLFWQPLLVLVLAPLHSLINVSVLAMLKRSVSSYRMALIVLLSLSIAAALAAVSLGGA